MSPPADNPMVLVCKKCGESNRLPSVHCRKCGAKLDFDKAEETLKKEAHAPRHPGRTVRSLVLLALVAVLALALCSGRRETGGFRPGGIPAACGDPGRYGSLRPQPEGAVQVCKQNGSRRDCDPGGR